MLSNLFRFALAAALLLSVQEAAKAAAAAIFLREASEPSTVTAFHLTDQDGAPFTERKLARHLTVINFFFSSCHGPCPAVSAEIAKLARQFKDEPRVQFVSISVDPEHDSPEALAEFRRRFVASEENLRWYLLRGDAEKVRELASHGLQIALLGPGLRLILNFTLFDEHHISCPLS